MEDGDQELMVFCANDYLSGKSVTPYMNVEHSLWIVFFVVNCLLLK